MNMLIALDDKSKLEEFVRQLPEEYVSSLDMYKNITQFHGGEFFISKMNHQYGLYFELPFAEFLNPVIEEARKKLNGSYDNFCGFFILKPNSHILCSDKIGKNIIGEEKFEFNKRLSEFTTAYYSFLKIAHSELTDKKMRFSKYIDKSAENFIYQGKILDISKENDAYRVFNILYGNLPNGGFVSYTDLIDEIRKSDNLKKVHKFTKSKLIKFIQTALTDNSNGFLHYAKILPVQDGKKIIKSMRAKGIQFNNTIG